MSVLVLGALVSQGCDEEYSSFVSLEQTRVQSSLLARIQRADGSAIPDLVQAIQDQYGFRAQVMNFVIPSVTIALSSSLCERSPSEFQAVAQISGWETFAPAVINDAQSLEFTLQLNGLPMEECKHSDMDAYRDHFDQYLALYADLTQGELNQNLTLEILGVDADGTQRVLSLPPSEVQYGCIGDVSKVVIAADTAKSVWWDVWLQDDAAQCAGQVRFALDAPSARMSIRKK